MNNEVLEAMQLRRSIRSFKPDPVPETDLQEIIKAGLYAPSGRGSQDTIILAITNPAMVKRLSRLNCEIGGWAPDFDPFTGHRPCSSYWRTRRSPRKCMTGPWSWGI